MWGDGDSCKFIKMISIATDDSVFTMNDLRIDNEILKVEDIREFGQLGVILERIGLWKSVHYKLSSPLSPKVGLERVSMKMIPIASILGSLYVSMVCVVPNLANLARLKGVSMSDPKREHFEAVKWDKDTLSCQAVGCFIGE